MAGVTMPSLLAFSAVLLATLLSFPSVEGRIPGVYTGGDWQSAHATFYGGSDASGTMGTSSKLLTLALLLHVLSSRLIPGRHHGL
jgi:ABC-type uncharacterized transport system YnjBCD permease subunit